MKVASPSSDAVPAELHGGGRFVLSRKKFVPAYVRAFEEGLLVLMRNERQDILDDIRKSGDLSDATAGKLKAAVDAYAKTFA